MADTQRATSTLLALLPDNTSGDISPQDLRDVVVSILGGYGGLRCDGTSSVMTGIGPTPTKVTHWTHALKSDGSVVSANTAADTVTPSVAADYEAHFSLSVGGTASQNYVFEVYVNGVATGVRAKVQMPSTGGTVNVAASGTITVSASQAVELRVSASAAGSTLSADSGQLWIKRVG